MMTDDLKSLGENYQTPDEVESEIFSTLDSMKLLVDIVDLFTMKFIKTKSEILGLSLDEDNETKK